jgi:hypothetical protein
MIEEDYQHNADNYNNDNYETMYRNEDDLEYYYEKHLFCGGDY